MKKRFDATALAHELDRQTIQQMSDEVFVYVVNLYKEVYGNISEPMEKELRLRTARKRYTNLLVKDGYIREGLEAWTVVELRDECEKNRLVLVGNKVA